MKQNVYDPPEGYLLGGLYSSGGSLNHAHPDGKEVKVWIETKC